MTVSDLIAKLSTYPADARVICKRPVAAVLHCG